MAPKKAVAAVEGGKENGAATGPSKVKVKRKSIKLVKTQSHPPTLAMVVEVLKKNTERKGTSVQAIRTRILAAHPTVDPLRLKFLLRTALNKGIEKGILMRPLNSSATGATGRFKLAKPVKKPKAGKENAKSENVDPNAEPENVDPNAEQKPQKKAPKKEKKDKTDKEPKGEKTKAESKKAKEESDEKPKAAKSKKDTEAKEVEKAPAKKPKAKTDAAKAEGKAKKEPLKGKAKEAKAESTKAQKDSTDEAPPVKAGKKGKK